MLNNLLKRTNVKKLLLHICTLLFIPFMYGQELDSVRMLRVDEMTLEELLNIKVTTASKKPQGINFAPADILVVTQQMILERGYKDLKDVFRDLPGFDFSENVEGEVRTIVINRGILGNNKLMILRDGKKLNVTTGERFVYGNNLPLFNVSRIEVIFGPTSAIYGADAYSGVINLISKSAKDINGVEVNSSVGSNASFDESVLFGKKFDNDLELFISARKYNSRGIDPTGFPDYQNYNHEFSQPTNDYNIFSTIKTGDFTLGLYRMDANEPNGYGTRPDQGDDWYVFNDSYVWHQVINKAFFDHLFSNNSVLND